MKQIIILSLLNIFYFNAFSQITILRSDYTVSGVVSDITRSKELSIVGLSIPQRGGNRTFDYTTVKDTTTTNTIVNSPVNTALMPPEFKDATFLSSPRPALGTYSVVDSQYRKLDATGLHILGYKRGNALAWPVTVSIGTQTGSSTDSLAILSRLSRYVTPPYQVKFPMTSSTLSKVQTVDTLSYQLSWASAGYTKADVKFIRHAEYTTEVIGWGTLRLRNSTLGGPALSFGVLLERYAELRQDSFYLNGAPMAKRVLDSFRLIQGKRDTATLIYSLRGMGFKRGILSFNMSPDEAFIVSASRVIDTVGGILQGTRDVASFDVPLSVFPNPTTEGVSFEFDKKNNNTWQAVIFNELGQIIDFQAIEARQGHVIHRVVLDKSLPAGTYFVNIMDETSLIRSNGRFVKM